MDTPDTPKRPYAATANVMAVLNRVRTRNTPAIIDSEFYRLASIGEAVHGRVTNALAFLGLIDEGEFQDVPSALLRSMAEAPEAEFKELLATSIREAYAPEFAKVDPAQDSQAQIIDAFRRYEPRSQTQRMVMLFLGLCREAGIPVKDVPRDRKMASAARTSSPRPSGRRPAPAAASGSSGSSRHVGHGAAGGPEVMFGGVTIDDIAAFGDDFDEVWSALGKVTRAVALARSKAKMAPPTPAPTADDDKGGAGN